MRSEEKQKGGFYIKNPPFPLFYPLSYYAAPYLIALTNALLRLCCSVLKYKQGFQQVIPTERQQTAMRFLQSL